MLAGLNPTWIDHDNEIGDFKSRIRHETFGQDCAHGIGYALMDADVFIEAEQDEHQANGEPG